MSREAAKERILQTVQKGPARFMWVTLIRDVCEDLGIDLGKHAKTAPDHTRQVLLGLFPNRQDLWDEINWEANDAAYAKLAITMIEFHVKWAMENLPSDPPMAEPVENKETVSRAKRPAPPAPPRAPAPPPAPVAAS